MRQTVLNSSEMFIWEGESHIQPPAPCDWEQKLNRWSHSDFKRRNPILRHFKETIAMCNFVNKNSYAVAEFGPESDLSNYHISK